MGEPLEAVEGSDSEISRLFPKCRPRSATNTPTTTTPTDARRSDLNLNCVLDSDDNDNYEPQHTSASDLPRLYDNSKLSRDSGSSGRMSVDSGSGSRSGSTPGSRSDSHSGSHSESAKMERSAEDVDMDMDVSVVSAYDDYEDRYMRSSVLDSSYEEAPPQLPLASRHQPQRREHFRLRDSRIEIAGGREVFSHSRSRPARRRHDESQRRRGQQQQQQYQQERQQQEQHWPESPGNSEEHSHGCSVRESPLVYETRLTGSSEVVFDDIGEWVARGLTVRALDDRPGTPTSPTAQLPGESAELGDHGYLAAYERSTSPSDSDSTQESTTHKVTKIGNVPIAEYEGSPRRYGPRPSPRSHSPRAGHNAPPPRPPRPGFPRRVLAEEEAARESSSEPPAATSSEASVPQGDDREMTPQEDPSSDLPGPDSCSEAESDSPAPPVIAISTLTSSYSGSLTTQPNPDTLDTDMYDYSYEMSETRKVLEEFFKEQGGRRDEFLDLEYHLKRQQGNSYVGLRLAAEYSEDQSLAEGGEQQPPQLHQQQQTSSELDNTISELINNSLEHHSTGSEHLSNSTEVQNNPGEQHGNDTEHHTSGVELHSRDTEQQNNGPDQQTRPADQQTRPADQHTSPSADLNIEHVQELGSPTNEVSSASPDLLNHLDLSYEAQQDTAQEQHQAPDSISNSSNCSTHSSNSIHSETGCQEDLGDCLSEPPQDPFPESSTLYDRLNEVVVAALGRECDLDDRSGNDNPGPGSCTDDLSGHEDPGLLDLSIEGDHDTASTNPQTEDLAETEVGLQVGHSRNFTLSPETTSCDSGDVESDYSGVDPEGSIHSSSRGICSAMPVLEDGLSSGDESGMEVPEEEDSKESLFEQEQEQLQQEQLQQQQRPVVRSLDEQLCRGELPPLYPLPTLNSHNSPLPNAASSPHTKLHSRNSPHTNAQSPSSSTLKLMKKQITEIEREIALRRPEGGARRGGHDGEGPQPPLDLHLLDPLISGPSTGPHLLSAMGSLTSPVQHKVTPHMVQGHPAAHDIHLNPGGGVGQSRESVEAAIADIKQAIRRTKNLPVKSHPQDRSPINDKAPVWIPRNSSTNRREPQQLQQQQQQQQQPNSGEQSPQQQQQLLETASAETTRSPDHLRHEDGLESEHFTWGKEQLLNDGCNPPSLVVHVFVPTHSPTLFHCVAEFSLLLSLSLFTGNVSLFNNTFTVFNDSFI
nr:uncharacterized protein LOC123762353 isoform X2 [Procambarus clarkii]